MFLSKQLFINFSTRQTLVKPAVAEQRAIILLLTRAIVLRDSTHDQPDQQANHHQATESNHPARNSVYHGDQLLVFGILFFRPAFEGEGYVIERATSQISKPIITRARNPPIHISIPCIISIYLLTHNRPDARCCAFHHSRKLRSLSSAKRPDGQLSLQC